MMSSSATGPFASPSFIAGVFPVVMSHLKDGQHYGQVLGLVRRVAVPHAPVRAGRGVWPFRQGEAAAHPHEEAVDRVK